MLFEGIFDPVNMEQDGCWGRKKPRPLVVKDAEQACE
jgi:hypothetical protein